MDGRELVAWNLRRLRVAEGLSQEKLAADAEIDRAYVGRLERATENPTVAVLERLAKALSARIGDFFIEPRPGAKPPRPLPSGRRPAAAKRASPKPRG
jgi:transcriptional regulator with XRE-family HTH domain